MGVRGNGSIVLTASWLAVACASTAGAAGPRIVSVHTGPPVLDRAMELRVTAQPRGTHVQGLRVSFPELGGVFAASACRIGPARRAESSDTGRNHFAVPYRPSWAGLHLLELAVTAGDCGAPKATSRRSLPLEVGAATVGAPAAIASSRVAAASDCPGADNLPLRPRLRALRLSIVCLINAERRAAGVPGLRTSRALRRSALALVHDMRERQYVGHAGPDGHPALPERLRAAGVEATYTAENIGVGPGRLGTPRSIVSSWMASDPMRRNMLDPVYRTVGVAALSTVPGVMRRSGGTYAADFAG